MVQCTGGVNSGFSWHIYSNIRNIYSCQAIYQYPSPIFREVNQVVKRGLIIEEYPNDPRGPSCLMLGYGLDSRPIHIVCAPKDDFLAVITAYLPDAEEWSEDFRKRNKP